MTISVSPISEDEAASLGIPDSILGGTAGRHAAGRQFGELDSEFEFLIHVPLSSEVVATFGAQDMGVRFVGFGKINQRVALEAL